MTYDKLSDIRDRQVPDRRDDFNKKKDLHYTGLPKRILSKRTSCETIRRFDIYLAERQVKKDIGAEVIR